MTANGLILTEDDSIITGDDQKMTWRCEARCVNMTYARLSLVSPKNRQLLPTNTDHLNIHTCFNHLVDLVNLIQINGGIAIREQRLQIAVTLAYPCEPLDEQGDTFQLSPTSVDLQTTLTIRKKTVNNMFQTCIRKVEKSNG